MKAPESRITRRRFVATASIGATALAVPAVAVASKTKRRPIIGTGEHRYEIVHDWPQLPSRFNWQTTHDIAIDREGLVYVIHEGRPDQPEHPAIFVFDQQGRYVHSFGNQFQGGAHGLEVRDENGEQFLYVCGYQPKVFAKLTLRGEVVWLRHAPMESGLYANGEDNGSTNRGERDNFMPTNFAFLPNGEFLLADGYGSFYVHHMDPEGKWLGCFGGPGDGDGRFNTPHGIWIDDRDREHSRIVVADRTHGRLQWFSHDFKHQHTLAEFISPANIDCWNGLMLIPDMASRVTLLDENNKIVTHLGENAAWRNEVAKGEIRNQPNRWLPGLFVHPHDACFDSEGNIYVAEFVTTGRISRLRRL